jgi:hypothetical protein
MMDTAIKPTVRREADVEALVVAALQRIGRAATSAEIWRLVDAEFDISFEVRRVVFANLLDLAVLVMEEYRDNRLPEPLVRLYRLGLFKDSSKKGGTDARNATA